MPVLSCPSCMSSDTTVFHNPEPVPAHSIISIPDRTHAIEYPRGNLSLSFCRSCGFIFNNAYNPALQEYSDQCEESQGFSKTYTAFALNTADELIRKYDLRDKSIVEIGCGKGEFLRLLCALGNNTGIGYDPAYNETRYSADMPDSVTFVKDFFTEIYADQISADFICCRMTLEHISRTGDFIRQVRKAARKPGTIVYFQVPNAARIFSTCAFEDIYYEHCSYFSPVSLSRLFKRNGFEIMDERSEYDGQYLVLEAGAIDPADGEIEISNEDDKRNIALLEDLVTKFPARFAAKTDFWKEFLAAESGAGRKTVLWGSGSKAVSFLTTLNVTREIEYIVDISPYRQGTYMAGTGHPVMAPEFLAEYKPDSVIVMNEVYVKEIKEKLVSIGSHPELLTLEMAGIVLDK